eukprot:gene7553-1350_t
MTSKGEDFEGWEDMVTFVEDEGESLEEGQASCGYWEQ